MFYAQIIIFLRAYSIAQESQDYRSAIRRNLEVNNSFHRASWLNQSIE